MRVEVPIDVLTASVTPDDYMIQRHRECTSRLFHPTERKGSACYNTDVYQAARKIGETR